MGGMSNKDRFLFTTCQVGVEWALKDEFARRWPGLRFAFSRPGFVTFKVTDESFNEQHLPCSTSVFARTCGWSLGRVESGDLTEVAKRAWELLGERAVQHVHVWQRDRATPGEHGFEPGRWEMADEAAREIAASSPHCDLDDLQNRPTAREASVEANAVARPNQGVLDCVLVEPEQWWIGYHHTESVAQRWPGGVPKIAPPEAMISRAYLKMSEALLWSRLPCREGDAFVEIGCAPGGSCQALLERGMRVTGIDPADVDARLLANTNFTHIKKRGADLKRREFRPFRWLTADVNVAPRYTLDTVEAIVTHGDVKIRGLLLTLKMLDESMYGQIDEYVERVRAWGYDQVRVRQLAFNRQEVTLAARK